MNENTFDEFLESLRQGGEILQGTAAPSRRFAVEAIDVRRIRENYGLTQQQFAALLGVSVDSVQNWEQGRRKPRGAAQVLLRIAEKHPEVVLEASRQGVKPV